MTWEEIGEMAILSPKETAAIVHDLQVHQVELETQNEELRNAQLTLEESRKKYSELYNFAPVGYMTFDEHGIILEVNLTIANMLETERYLLVNHPMSAFIVPEYQDTLYKHRQRLEKIKERVCCELQLKKATGEPFWAGVESIAVTSQSGSERGFKCVVIDISERKKSEAALLEAHEELERRVEKRTAELRAANEALRNEISEHKRTEKERLALERQVQQAQKRESLTTMAGAIAHHFNNQLTTVLGYLELAREDVPRTSKLGEYLLQSENAAKRSAELSRLMLTYVGLGQRRKQPLDLTALVQDLLPGIQSAMPATVRLDVDPLSAVSPVMMDPGDARQVVMNLVTNSWDAIGSEDGTIGIVVRSVSDNSLSGYALYSTDRKM